MAPEGPLAGLVLAAGFSTRAGSRNKLLARVDGEPMVVRVARVARAAGLDPVVVVTGHDAVAVEAALAAGGAGVETVRNPRPADGLASSLVRGVAALPAGVAGAVVLLGDMPWVAPATIERLRAVFAPGAGRSVCVPRHGGRRGNPLLWGADHFADLARLTGDAGARRLLRDRPEAVVYVDVEDPGVLRDVDDAETLARLDDGSG